MYKKKSRRPYGTGTVSINRKIGRYTVLWNDDDGKKHSCSKFPLTPVGKKEAEQFLADINMARADGVRIADDETLGKWLKTRLEHDSEAIRESTKQSRAYAGMYITKYAPNLIEMHIGDITVKHIQDMYKSMLSNNMATSTVNRVHVLLYSTFRMAYKARIIRYNIMFDVVPPRIKKTDIEIFSWRQIGSIFHFLAKQQKFANRMSHDYKLLFRILQGTGMRIGELLALRWDDIDFSKREIHIHATVSGKNGTILENPKTASGNRRVPILSNRTLSMLQKASEGKTGWVIQSEKGSRIPYSNIHREWRRITNATGITQTIHCWRHTFATRMLAEGFPVTEISRILGHSSEAITLTMYSHAIPSFNQQMIEMYNNRRKQDKDK